MAYKLYKLVSDNRNSTCGYFIPNGGFYYVVEMTFENHEQLQNLSRAAGYSVDFVDGPVGFFDKDGYEVIEGSVVVDKITKGVIDYQVKTKTVRGKESKVKAKHVTKERSEAIEAARQLGYSVSEKASTQTIKQVAERGKRAGTSTLSVTLS